MKRIVTLLLAMAMALGMAACAPTNTDDTAGNAAQGAGGSGEPTGELTSITIPSYQVGENAGATYFEAAVERFNEKYAGQYEIVLEEVTEADYFTQLSRLAQTGNLPLIVCGAPATTADFVNTVLVPQKLYDYNQPCIVNAVTKLKDMWGDYAASNSLGAAYADAANAFMSNQAAVICNGPWMNTDFAEASSSNWSNGFSGSSVRGDIYPGNVALANTATYGRWIVTNNYKSEEELNCALAFIEFLYSQEELEAFMLIEGGQCPNMTYTEDFLTELSQNTLLADQSAAITADTVIGCHSSSDILSLTYSLEKMREQVPNLYPIFHIVPFQHLYQRLSEEAVDVVVAFREDSIKKSIRFQELTKVPVVGIAKGHSFFPQKEQLQLDDLKRCPLIALAPQKCPEEYRNLLHQVLADRSPEGVYFCDAFEAAVALAQAGYGVAMLPDLLQARNGALRYLPILDAAPMSYGIYYKTLTGQPLRNTFVKLAKESFLQHPISNAPCR